MITFHCTKKLLSRLPVGVGEQLRSEYSNHFAANDATPTLPHLAPPTRAPPATLSLFAGKDSSTTALHQQGSQ